ncbi:MAG TPA: hypothetical protein VIK66_09760 [Gaiellaceae bacterium]|jgi:hypothetical protein
MLESPLEIEASYESVAQAVRDAAYGESTLLACRGALGVEQSVAVAEQHLHALELEDEVRISVGHGRIHVHPADTPARRRLPNVPGGLDRRSVFDRRVGERRKAVAAQLPHGERRSGTDRRTGSDRRRPVRVGVPR